MCEKSQPQLLVLLSLVELQVSESFVVVSIQYTHQLDLLHTSDHALPNEIVYWVEWHHELYDHIETDIMKEVNNHHSHL